MPPWCSLDDAVLALRDAGGRRRRHPRRPARPAPTSATATVVRLRADGLTRAAGTEPSIRDDPAGRTSTARAEEADRPRRCRSRSSSTTLGNSGAETVRRAAPGSDRLRLEAVVQRGDRLDPATCRSSMIEAADRRGGAYWVASDGCTPTSTRRPRAATLSMRRPSGSVLLVVQRRCGYAISPATDQVGLLQTATCCCCSPKYGSNGNDPACSTRGRRAGLVAAGDQPEPRLGRSGPRPAVWQPSVPPHLQTVNARRLFPPVTVRAS